MTNVSIPEVEKLVNNFFECDEKIKPLLSNSSVINAETMLLQHLAKALSALNLK